MHEAALAVASGGLRSKRELIIIIFKLFSPSASTAILVFLPTGNIMVKFPCGPLKVAGVSNACGVVCKIAIFNQYLALSGKQSKIGPCLLWNANGNSYAVYRMVSFPMTSSDLAEFSTTRSARDVSATAKLLVFSSIAVKKFDQYE